MKLCRFATAVDIWALGRVDGERVVSLASLGYGGSMRALLTERFGRLEELAGIEGEEYALDEVHLGAPIVDPQKFLAIGLNYKAHAEEATAAGRTLPTSQMWFNKQVSCINGPFDPVDHPTIVEKLDYEGELGFVLGKRCRNVRAEDAHAVIAGYLVCNDVSARDWQARSPTLTLGKSFDTHGPIGPWLTTADEIADPSALTLTVTVNGEQRQHASIGDMVHPIADQIAYLSSVMTLEPGDIVSTGTPSGVGLALQKLLRAGDVVRVEIPGLGHIENRIRG